MTKVDNSIWIYTANETEEYCHSVQTIIFKSDEIETAEVKARHFWETKKKEILDTTDADYYVIEDDGDSLSIYEDGNAGEFDWYYSIGPATVYEN